MDSATLQSLLGGTIGSNSSPILDINSLLQPLMPYIITLTIVSVVIAALYLLSIIQKWRANAAVLEIRDILRDMRAQSQQKPAPTTPNDDGESYAA